MPIDDLCQFFLVNQSKISAMVDVLGVEGADVIELGGGQGRIAVELLSRHPRSLTVVELDSALADALRQRFKDDPLVKVVHADGYDALVAFTGTCVLSNLPIALTAKTVAAVTSRETITRCVMVADAHAADLSLPDGWHASDVEELQGDDFTPYQDVTSRVVRLVRD